MLRCRKPWNFGRTKISIKRALRLYEMGYSVHNIGKRLGCTGSTVWYAFRRAGIKRRRCGRKIKVVKNLGRSLPGFDYMEKTQTGWYCHGKDLTDLMWRAIRGHLSCDRPDATLNIETHLFNTVLAADSCSYELDVGRHVWLNQGRWSRLIREYVPAEPVARFIGQATEIMQGEARSGATANFLFRDPDRHAKKHRWGGCLMGATFRGDNGRSGPATLTFYSRTTYIGYMGLLDAAIANRIAASIADPSQIRFLWYLSSQQLHAFKTLPYVYSQPDLMERLERYARNRGLIAKAPPTWKELSKWYCKVLDGWGKFFKKADRLPEHCAEEWLNTEKYGPFRRIKRRWCEYRGFLNKLVPPSLPVNELTLEKAI